ncbi:GNAT family N-acetyltransferase [Paludibacterium yongneupense]|uniref:GNAT family N-acetyltransferase n=1 Tax=Paludibacterium yongneupense TaxID=400061 RepID=UPI0003FFDBCB|nr:GNAT family N-acetyltransferase [Paludibacterium yongneupense]
MRFVDGFHQPVEESYELIRSVYRASDGFVATIDEMFPDQAAFARHLTELAALPGAVFLLARDDAAAGGYLFVKPRPWQRLAHTADLNMGVAPGWQGRGVGHGLLLNAQERMTKEGVLEIIYLMVRADNHAARHLYEKVGFAHQALLRRDTKVGADYFDGILMSRPVRAAAPETETGMRRAKGAPC